MNEVGSGLVMSSVFHSLVRERGARTSAAKKIKSGDRFNYQQQVTRVQDLLPKLCLPQTKEALGFDLRCLYMFTWESCTFGVRPQLKTKDGGWKSLGAC